MRCNLPSISCLIHSTLMSLRAAFIAECLATSYSRGYCVCACAIGGWRRVLCMCLPLLSHSVHPPIGGRFFFCFGFFFSFGITALGSLFWRSCCSSWSNPSVSGLTVSLVMENPGTLCLWIMFFLSNEVFMDRIQSPFKKKVVITLCFSDRNPLSKVIVVF